MRKIIISLGLLLIFLSQSRWSWAVPPSKSVLILDSYGRNVAPITTYISVFRTALTSQSPEPIDLQEVSLEMAHFAEPEKEVPFVNFLKERYSARNPDLVVSIGGPAFTFLSRHYEEIFPDSLMLITGVAERILSAGQVPRNAAVVPLEIDLQGMIENILQLLPKTQNIYVVFGVSALERFWLNECRREFAAFSSRVNFTYTDQMPFDEIKRRVAALPPNSAVFYGLLIVDSAGTFYDPGLAIKDIIAAANAPVFSVHESLFGVGTVGGRLLPERAAGLRAADAAIKILRGEFPAKLSIPPLASQSPVFDWRALQRWGINESRLPQGSTIFFRQPNLWTLYHWHIAGAIILLIFQSFMIGRLLVQKRRRDFAERELVKSEQRLQMITDALPVVIAYIDSEQRYRFNNGAYKHWFGFSPEEAQGRTVREVVGERYYRNVVSYIDRALGGEKIQFTQDIELDEGRSISIEAIYIPDVDEQGAVRGLYILAIDITERKQAQLESKRLQDELMHAGRISTMGQLAGTLAHEINQPLSAIMSNAQAATRYLNAPTPNLEEVKEILHDIVQEDARAGEVINRLRGLLKKNTLVFEAVDMNLIVHDVVGFLHSDAVIRDVRVSLELAPLLPSVKGDRIQLQQVVLNLLVNAFDAVNGCPRGDRRVLIRSFLNDSKVLISVADSGKGIPNGEKERIFKPYHTSKPQGLGMGLSISRSIIKRHQGHIWVENNSEGGATFFFTLPIS